jgi:5-methylcytosine-specific restriction endonuclease McrBC GTP-binding regulatory subunit McrB
LFAEKDDGKAHFRFSLELYDAQSKQEDYDRHHKLLNRDIADASDKLVYMAGGIDYDAPLAQLNLSTAEVKKGVENGIYKKIQLSRIIERSNIEHNFGMLNSLLEAVEALMPYYNLVVKGGDVVPMTDTKISKNTILYGPPGTGKTYNAVNYAVAIVENKAVEDVDAEDYSSVLQKYHTYKKEGKIAFTTFHQSYGYEEFIEGIKPEISSDDEESDDLAYKIEPGIFKKFCETAGTKTLKISNVYIKEMPQVWCVILQDRSGCEHNKLKQRCFSNNYVKIGWPEQDSVSEHEIEKFNPLENAIIKNFCDQMEKGDIVVIQSGQQTIDALGVVKGDYWYDKEDPEFPRTREVSWLKTNIDENIYSMNGNVALDRKSTYQLKRISPNDALALVAKYSDTDEVNLSENKSNYVFIIDEINRGNISKIFGELITLIESTKRLGEAEAATAILPYSGDDFGVPGNVYILGTMNTADRSIALMDTALRRRFHFVEMMPDSSVLSKLQITDVNGIDIIKMLDIINERIEYLFDREHTIGHAYFTGLKDEPTLEKLADIFQNEIIPLLQEYFYEDYSKIQLVLGDNEKEDSFKFILDEALKVKEVFKDEKSVRLYY